MVRMDLYVLEIPITLVVITELIIGYVIIHVFVVLMEHITLEPQILCALHLIQFVELLYLRLVLLDLVVEEYEKTTHTSILIADFI